MSKRRSIEVSGLEHVHPIPNASRIGPLLMTGGIYGKDPATGKLAPDAPGQCKLMFENIRRVHLNPEWLAMFPDPHSRPTRHTFLDTDQPYGALVSCEVIAVVGE